MNLGRTPYGTTDWRDYKDDAGNQLGVYVEVDVGEAGLSDLYFTSLGGDSAHWTTVGATSIYWSPEANHFRIYLATPYGDKLTADFVKQQKWFVEWLGFWLIN